LYSSPNIFRIVKSRRVRRWAGHVVGIGGKKNMFRRLVGKPEGKRRFGGCKDNIKVDLKNIGVHWIHVAQDRNQEHAFVSTVVNLWVTQKVKKNLLTR
jgi:hypothetical protein